jgi:simple sugar transport system permease protein
MNILSLLTAVLHSAVVSATPILFAALGEIYAERSGVMNLGLEGLMLVGAATGFLVTYRTHDLVLGVLMAMAVAAFLGLVFSLIVITLKANQVVTGLVMTIFGTGLSSFIGRTVVAQSAPVVFNAIPIPFLVKIPLLGPILFNQDLLVYLLYVLVPVSWLIIYRTRIGLELRSVGENPAAADALGLNVFAFRYLSVCLGSALAGLAGAYLSLAYAPTWLENMTNGRGWIAIVLVIFATWNPLKAALGALLFGCFDVLGFRLQAMGLHISPYFLGMLPYLITIIVLVMISVTSLRAKNPMPKALTIPYDREER